MDVAAVIKSDQEQAVASWIGYLNNIRIERIREALSSEKINLGKATREINKALDIIDKDIINKGAGRGGPHGMHGFIAEVAECGVGNARSLAKGGSKVYEWLDDNSPSDLKRGVEMIQQKFYNSGGHLSLQAVKKHFTQYPDYLEKGGKYQIPADHYKKIKWLLSIPKEEADKMPTSTGDFSLKQWREVHEFFEANEIPLEKIEPAHLEYNEVQRETYKKTLNSEKKELKKQKDERVDRVIKKNAPSLQEGLKATVGAAAVEGGMTFCLNIIRKIRAGKRLVEFDYDDWVEIASESGVGFLKGGVRGASIYLLTNTTCTTAESASAIVTAAFGIAQQVHLYRNGALSKAELIKNSEIVCLEASISALSTFAGQVIIPVPILGPVIGNAVGTMMYQLAKDYFIEKEQTVFKEYIEDINKLQICLDEQYKEYLNQISDYMKVFLKLTEEAFSLDPIIAFSGSIELAKSLGVPTDEILDTKEKVFAYFMN